MLPKDPFILFSVLNTRLRDSYSSLDALCKSECADIDEVIASMKAIGYSYDYDTNSFRKL